MHKYGVVAAGHQQTASAAEEILRSGGNAFDAIVAAHLAACVCEPVLSSLGGGGFLLAHTAEKTSCLYDFFVQTPLQRCDNSETEFFPISANFGTVRQEFYIGRGSIATPGTVKGLFTVYQELCTLPIQRLAEPAIELARNGVEMNAFQAYILDIVSPIYLAYPETRSIFASRLGDKPLLQQGEILHQPELADVIENLALEGEALFYQGEIARAVSQLCIDQGGHLTEQDFNRYQLIKRQPLSINYRQCTLLTNPPPSSGGTLIAFALKLLESFDLGSFRFGSEAYLKLLAQVQALTDQARLDACSDNVSLHPDTGLLDAENIDAYRTKIKDRASCTRGTTHISVIDQHGNFAGLTTSNGEGCGLFIPDTGIMLNNMLGEQDLNPHGFQQWPTNQRMTSMMAPSILFQPDNRTVVLGSGGSNRLRTAILQVLLNLIDFEMPLEQAINSPRIHYEAGHLAIEGGFEANQVKQLIQDYPNHKLWDSRNLFFGGVHSARRVDNEFSGIGDPRRGGVAFVIS